ncbi:MAG: benzoate-CoA ligase family protein [Archangium gephyra]|uniref:Benzoate-CoA ligase family protein n=1 Tax=Archangium gephyra TaxID=48 RepID=A0A2W5U2U2_9BACT|nr:MAG: benzoate-CoA ligase family protein [Archangium gephyra]
MRLDPFNLPERLNLAQVFLHAQAAQHPERPAIYFEEETITYAQLADATHRASAVFRGLGLEWEQRVILMLPDVPQFASAWLGTVEAGGTISAVNPGLKAEEVTYYLNYTRAKFVVTDAETAAIIDSVRAQCPHLDHVLVAGGNAGTHLDYDAELTRARPDGVIADTHKEDVCVWLYTSGSTGFPKAAVHKHADFVFNALTYGLPVVGYGPNDISVSVPRLAFGYALGSNLLFPLLAGGATALFKEKPTPEKFFEMLKKHRPTMFTAVPTALNGILNSPGIKDADFSSLRVAISAGEALPAELYQRWKQRTGVEILDGIGSAEMFHIFITNRVNDVKLGSLGKVVDGYTAKVCDENGNELPRGEVGTLWVKGESMALEYWQQRAKSKTTFRGEWCVSADKFQQTEDGYFYFCGRGDDMLKVSGKWLSPVEVENVLLQHPAVREAAVVSFKDADGLDKPRAFVALNEGHTADDALAEDLKAHVRSRLEPFKAPRQVKFLDALPRSDRGKVLKTELRG